MSWCLGKEPFEHLQEVNTQIAGHLHFQDDLYLVYVFVLEKPSICSQSSALSCLLDKLICLNHVFYCHFWFQQDSILMVLKSWPLFFTRGPEVALNRSILTSVRYRTQIFIPAKYWMLILISVRYQTLFLFQRDITLILISVRYQTIILISVRYQTIILISVRYPALILISVGYRNINLISAKYQSLILILVWYQTLILISVRYQTLIGNTVAQW